MDFKAVAATIVEQKKQIDSVEGLIRSIISGRRRLENELDLPVSLRPEEIGKLLLPSAADHDRSQTFYQWATHLRDERLDFRDDGVFVRGYIISKHHPREHAPWAPSWAAYEREPREWDNMFIPMDVLVDVFTRREEQPKFGQDTLVLRSPAVHAWVKADAQKLVTAMIQRAEQTQAILEANFAKTSHHYDWNEAVQRAEIQAQGPQYYMTTGKPPEKK